MGLQNLIFQSLRIKEYRLVEEFALETSSEQIVVHDVNHNLDVIIKSS